MPVLPLKLEAARWASHVDRQGFWRPPSVGEPTFPSSAIDLLCGAVRSPAGGRRRSSGALNQFDLVAVRVFNKGNDRLAMLHRAGFTDHLATPLVDFGTGGSRVRNG